MKLRKRHYQQTQSAATTLPGWDWDAAQNGRQRRRGAPGVCWRAHVVQVAKPGASLDETVDGEARHHGMPRATDGPPGVYVGVIRAGPDRFRIGCHDGSGAPGVLRVRSAALLGHCDSVPGRRLHFTRVSDIPRKIRV